MIKRLSHKGQNKISIHCLKSLQIRSYIWSVFSRIRTEYGEILRIRTEYGEILRISPYSVRMRENTDQKKTPYLDTFHAVIIMSKKWFSGGLTKNSFLWRVIFRSGYRKVLYKNVLLNLKVFLPKSATLMKRTFWQLFLSEWLHKLINF